MDRSFFQFIGWPFLVIVLMMKSHAVGEVAKSQEVGGVTVEFARAISGVQPLFAWSSVTDDSGWVEVLISANVRVSGYYRAQAHNKDGELVGRWNSIPLNANRRQILELTLGGGMRVLAVERLDSDAATISPEGHEQTVVRAKVIGAMELPKGVIAYYPFNGNAQDASGNGHHGTPSGPEPARDRFGNQGGAMLFSGTQHLIGLPHEVLNGQEDVTIAFWLKTSKAGEQAIVSGANRDNDNEHIVFLVNEGKIRYFSHGRAGFGGINECDVDIQPIADGEWHHFAVVRNAAEGNADFFIDGVGYLDRCENLNYDVLVIEEGGLILGQEQDQLGGKFDANQVLNGALDDLVFISRTLSAEEVMSLMNYRGPRSAAATKNVAEDVLAITGWLGSTFPNPFNSSTHISYRLAESGPVLLEIFNAMGQPVRILRDQIQHAGTYKAHWDARDHRGEIVAAGVYFVRLRIPGGMQSRPLLFIK